MVHEKLDMYLQGFPSQNTLKELKEPTGMLEKMGKMQVAIFEAPLGKLYTDARHMMSEKWQNRHEMTMMKYKQQLEEKLARLVKVLRCQDRLSWSQELHRTYSSREGAPATTTIVQETAEDLSGGLL